MFSRIASNILGAFSDGAILYPLLVLLASQASFTYSKLLITSGVAYLAAGWLFRIPMPVQPLKALVVAAVAIGASREEIRLGGALVGLVCLGVSLANVNVLVEKIPRSLIHGVQLGLGIILILKGVDFLLENQSKSLGQFLFLAPLLVLVSELIRFPILGIVATLGLIWAMAVPAQVAEGERIAAEMIPFRVGVVLSLVLPQIILTMTNSVVGTYDVARRYYPKEAIRVVPRRLLHSIGLGNLISAAISGLPFCHGSGGLTAHYRGGSSHWMSNIMIGGFLLGIGSLQFLGYQIRLGYSTLLLSLLLVAVGYFHLKLAKPSWHITSERLKLVLMGLTALATRNLLWVLVTGLVCEIPKWLAVRKKS